MIFSSGLTSTGEDECPTPQYVFDYLDHEFHFDLDVCATHYNAKCKEYYTKEDDGLKQPWFGTVFMNPPYGRTIDKWVAKAVEYAKNGGVTVAVLPSRTDNRWWQTFVMQSTEIRFVQGRFNFDGYNSCAPFPTAIAIFGTPKYPKISTISIPKPNREGA